MTPLAPQIPNKEQLRNDKKTQARKTQKRPFIRVEVLKTLVYRACAYPTFWLLLSYFLLRLLFQQWPSLKQLFIYPTGWLVSLFYNVGQFVGGEWLFHIGVTEFTLGDVCSGTTFFCLLCAFMIYRRVLVSQSLYWLLLAFPVTIIANAVRVVSSIEAHRFLVMIERVSVTSHVHALVGCMVFMATFILCSLVLDILAREETEKAPPLAKLSKQRRLV